MKDEASHTDLFFILLVGIPQQATLLPSQLALSSAHVVSRSSLEWALMSNPAFILSTFLIVAALLSAVREARGWIHLQTSPGCLKEEWTTKGLVLTCGWMHMFVWGKSVILRFKNSSCRRKIMWSFVWKDTEHIFLISDQFSTVFYIHLKHEYKTNNLHQTLCAPIKQTHL